MAAIRHRNLTRVRASFRVQEADGGRAMNWAWDHRKRHAVSSHGEEDRPAQSETTEKHATLAVEFMRDVEVEAK